MTESAYPHKGGPDGAGPDGRPDDLSAAVEAARSGDEWAFRLVYRAVAPGLRRYLRALVGDDADDVASEAWLQIARDIRSFTGDGDKFRGWAATVARNRALDHLRAHRRRPVTELTDEVLHSLAATHDTAASALEAVSTDAAVALIASLPRDQAEAVLLRVVVGLDAQSAAKVLGKRAGAVRTAAHRGLRRLAEQLDAAARADASPAPKRAADQAWEQRSAGERRADGERGPGGERGARRAYQPGSGG